jgi:hypothetical protein
MFRRSPERGRPRAGAQGYALPDETAEEVGARPWGRWAALAAAFAVVALTAPFLAARGPSAAGAPRPPTPSGCAEGPRPEGRFYVGRPDLAFPPPFAGTVRPFTLDFRPDPGATGRLDLHAVFLWRSLSLFETPWPKTVRAYATPTFPRTAP